MKKKRPTRRTWRGDDTTSGAAAVKKTAKVRTARQKVCPFFWKAWGAVRARTGVGTLFPLRLLAQTPALWRGVIFAGCPTSEVWETLYNSICLFQGQETTPPGDPAAARESGQNFTRRDARCHSTAKPFSAQRAQAPRIGSGRYSNFSRGKSYEKKNFRQDGHGEETTRRAPQR